MKKIIATFLVLLLIQINVFANNTVNFVVGNNVQTGETVKIENPLNVQITQRLDSKTASLEQVDRVPIIVVKTTTINGAKFSVGNEGYLNISDIDRSHNFGKGGTLVISNGKIKDNKGVEHYCQYKEVIIGKEHNMSKVLTAVGIFCWPLLFCCLKNGDEAVINKDSILTVSILE